MNDQQKPVTRRGIIPYGRIVTSITFLAEDEQEVIAWAEEHAAIYAIEGHRDSQILRIIYLPDPDNLAPFPIKYRVVNGGMIERVPTVIESEKESNP